MKTNLIIPFLLISIMLWSCSEDSQTSEPSTSPATGLQTIAFGSCAHQDKDTSLWEDIAAQQPDLWIWLGDNIYGDSENMDTLKAKYERAANKPGYMQLCATTPVIGIWDDHDYGVNDGGKEFAKKDSSKLLLLDFLQVQPDNPVYRHSGAYQSYVYGSGDRQIKVILLDTRYFRDTLERTPRGTDNRYIVNETGDILGEEQWAWLEQELTNSPAAIHLIGSSIQVLHEEQWFEKWANFPTARKRLLDLLVKTNPANPILLSGDRHIGEMAQMEVTGLSLPLLEITSSGLTHTWREDFGEANRYRLGETYVMQLNYGLIQVDWDNRTVTVELRGNGGAIWQSHTINI